MTGHGVELSRAQRHIVSLARAVDDDPTVLVMDEPVGFDESDAIWVAHRLKAARGAGTAIVVLEHDKGYILGPNNAVVGIDMSSADEEEGD